MSGTIRMGEAVVTGGFTTTKIPKCNHAWIKTMELRTDKRTVSYDYMIPVVVGIEQKFICIFCGEEKWESI